MRTRLLMLVALLGASPAWAGIVDSPLPVLSLGETTLHLYSLPGVINNTALGTYFGCVSTAGSPITVGVEVFGQPGGSPLNDATLSALTIGSGETVLFGTIPAAGLDENNLTGTPLFSKGSARILSTSKSLVCTAYLADTSNSPPTSMTYLTIVKKLKQKASN